LVIAGLDPAIPGATLRVVAMDRRVKPGGDENIKRFDVIR
jgi:hypothetical protein